MSERWWERAAEGILERDAAAERGARARLDRLTKPLGSLGRMEDLAAQMVAVLRGDADADLRPAVYVFAADHGLTEGGVAAEGVSAYPREVTRQMVLNFLGGGAAINALARLHGVELRVIDVGVDGEQGAGEGLVRARVRAGSRNMLREPAMTKAEVAEAVGVGVRMADAAWAEGRRLIAAGEMGIGNTTAASAMTVALTGLPAEVVTGRGTGVDGEARERKREVVEAAVERHFGEGRGAGADAAEVLRCLGGLEIAAMTGLYLRAAARGIAVVADGFISTAAAGVAVWLEPRVRPYLIAGHRSAEPGHRALLEMIGAEPLLDLGMRLGEGTGAVLAVPLVRSALALYREMATFEGAGVSGANA